MVAHQAVPRFKDWLDAVAVLGLGVRDREALGHNRRVAQLCVHIGRELAMTAAELRVLARSGLLHDVGKLGLPDAILEKDTSLDAAEWILMKSHPELGLSMLGKTGKAKREILAVLYHHERLDGSGYPYGLSGDAIPIEARIVAAADTYDALTSDRPYRNACSLAEARRVLLQESRGRLDPRVVAALLRALDAGGPTPRSTRVRFSPVVLAS